MSKLIDEFVLTLAGSCGVTVPLLGSLPPAVQLADAGQDEPDGNEHGPTARPLPQRDGGRPCRN